MNRPELDPDLGSMQYNGIDAWDCRLAFSFQPSGLRFQVLSVFNTRCRTRSRSFGDRRSQAGAWKRGRDRIPTSRPQHVDCRYADHYARARAAVSG
jgi:hypothetical protein